MPSLFLKSSLLVLALALSGCVASRTTVVRGGVGSAAVTLETFDSALSPYGSWVSIPGYGRVWQPSMAYVGSNFYPYGTGGQWVYSDAGWVFDSAYPFGWAVFHYGRWMRDPFRGWCWVPGTDWAPAWVSWRMGGPYVGWAPMGPYGAPMFHDHHWTFVEARLFTGPNVYAYAVPSHRFHEAVSVTRPVYGSVTGPSPTYISQATRTPVTPVPYHRLPSARGAVPPPPGARMSPPSAGPRTLPPPLPGAADARVRSLPPGRGGMMQPPERSSGARRDGFAAPPPAPTRRDGFGAPPPAMPRGDGYAFPSRERSAPPPATFPSRERSAPPPAMPRQGGSAFPSRERSAPPPMQAPSRAPSWGRSSAPPPPSFGRPPPSARPSYSMPAPSAPMQRRSPGPMMAPPPPPSRR